MNKTGTKSTFQQPGSKTMQAGNIQQMLKYAQQQQNSSINQSMKYYMQNK